MNITTTAQQNVLTFEAAESLLAGQLVSVFGGRLDADNWQSAIGVALDAADKGERLRVATDGVAGVLVTEAVARGDQIGIDANGMAVKAASGGIAFRAGVVIEGSRAGGLASVLLKFGSAAPASAPATGGGTPATPPAYAPAPASAVIELKAASGIAAGQFVAVDGNPPSPATWHQTIGVAENNAGAGETVRVITRGAVPVFTRHALTAGQEVALDESGMVVPAGPFGSRYLPLSAGVVVTGAEEFGMASLLLNIQPVSPARLPGTAGIGGHFLPRHEAFGHVFEITAIDKLTAHTFVTPKGHRAYSPLHATVVALDDANPGENLRVQASGIVDVICAQTLHNDKAHGVSIDTAGRLKWGPASPGWYMVGNLLSATDPGTQKATLLMNLAKI